MHHLLFIKPSDKIWGYSPYYGPDARRIPEPSTVGHAAWVPGSNADCFEEEEWNTSELAHGVSWENTMVVLVWVVGNWDFWKQMNVECIYIKIPATWTKARFWALLLWRHPQNWENFTDSRYVVYIYIHLQISVLLSLSRPFCILAMSWPRLLSFAPSMFWWNNGFRQSVNETRTWPNISRKT